MINILLGKMASGKDTILNEVIKLSDIRPLVSYTTRAVRDGEVNGVDYHFITNEQFEAKLSNGDFIEHNSNVHGDTKIYYGLAKESLEDNSIVILDVSGTKQLLANTTLSVNIFSIDTEEDIRLSRMINRNISNINDKYISYLNKRISAEEIEFTEEALNNLSVIHLSNNNSIELTKAVNIILELNNKISLLRA